MNQKTPHVGEIVLWYPDADTNGVPYPALVTVTGQTLCVSVFDQSSMNLRIRDGVRHAGDPRSRNPETRESGCWDWHPLSLELHAMRQELYSLKMALSVTSVSKKGS